MKAVIMAGGKGTRLRPLTCNVPKPMVPLLDKPVMEYAIELLKRHGITEIAVTVQHLPEVIRRYFGDGSEFGVRLHYFEEEAPLGTAGSVKNAEEFLDETFLVLSGDALTDYDLGAAVRFHKTKRATATLVLARVDVPLEFGVVMTDPKDRVVRFLEKPGWGEVFSDTVNTGIYILEPEVLRCFDRGMEFDFSKELFPMLLMMDRPMYGYRAEGYWSDIGNLAQYRQTQIDMLDGKVKVAIRGREVAPKVWVGEGVQAGRSAVLSGPAFVGRDCVLDDGVRIGAYSVIGAGSMLMREAIVERSVLWGQTVLEAHAEAKGAVLGRQSVVGAGALVEEGAVVGDNSRIGGKSIIRDGAKIWPGKTVDQSCQLNQSLIWGETGRRSLFGHWGVRGSCHGEITVGFAAKLAQAFSMILVPGRTVGIGHDGSPYAAMLADALGAGLHASGMYTHDFGAATSAVTRHAVYSGEYSAGIQVRAWAGESDMYLFELLDGNGLLLEGGLARKVEQAYMQEESRRVRPEQTGCRTAAPDVNLLYREHLLGMVDAEAIRSMGCTVVIRCGYRSHRGVIPELLESLGCRVVQIADPEGSRESLARIVQLTGADLGVSLDTNGQLKDLIDEKGTPVDEELLGVLQILLQLQEQDGAVYVPVHLPGIVERLGEAYNREVIRTKADVRSVMKGCEREGFHIRFDGIYMLVRLMEFRAREGCGLSRLTSLVPSFALSKRKVDCPWQDKGKVMRFLMEETRDARVELIDGIKVYHEEGWTLILPDSDEPVFRVVADAGTASQAEALAGVYARKIEDFRRRTTAS
ncbi:sugar phosphate nucleotidyltransferase [Gorillibacterium sp. sgz5001074]|uniref:sugar phosphate nucleotidyltransferase n=1 Tax=Gorillibacterium sp. sgz5001074 TaxID=3446695 RepID=UPI003F67FD57